MIDVEALNRMLFLRINAGADVSPTVASLANVIANDLIYIIPIILTFTWLWGSTDRRKAALLACIVAMLGVGMNQIIGVLWPHPRPFMLGLGHTYMPHAPDSSFPSDHMTIFVGTGLTLILQEMPLLGVTILLMSILVAWARIFLGVHFPLDMAGGVAVASVSYAMAKPVWALTGNPLVNWLERLYGHLMARPIARGWIRR